ncbi:MAG: hypothetical protein ABSA02_16850 [Trebonia sp.]|jgi:hypothetical protein
MSDLRESLNRGFAAIEPGPVPVEAAMLAGKKIRNRRRAGLFLGAAAVVAAAAVGVPVLAHEVALPSPPASGVRLTVAPPGPSAPVGTIASGLVGTSPWSAVIEYPGTVKCLETGTGVAPVNCGAGGRTQVLPTADGDPISITEYGVPNVAYQTGKFTYIICFGLVQPDVVSAQVVLADGTVLTLDPVTVGGSRWVAFPTWEEAPIDKIIAYSRTGQIATAIVHSYGNGLAHFVTGARIFGPWRQPG